MSLTFCKLKPARLRFLEAKVRRCNTQIIGRKLDETFVETHADIIQKIECKNFRSRKICQHVHLGSPINIVLWRGQQFISSLTARSTPACEALHTKPTPLAEINYPFEDSYEYTSDTSKSYHSGQFFNGGLIEKLPNDVDTLLTLHDSSRNFVKPYAYTADDIFLDQPQSLTGINGLDALTVKDLDTLFEVAVSESHVKERSNKTSCDRFGIEADVSMSKSPYGGSYILDFVEMVGFQKRNINALLGDINQYLSITNDVDEDIKKSLHQSPQDILAVLSKSVTNNIYNGVHMEQGMVYFSSPGGSTLKGIPDPKPEDRPNADQLNVIQNFMADSVPKLFTKRHDYRVYTKDIIFENNYAQKPYATRGLTPYILQVSKMRIYAHFTFANVRMHTVRIDQDEKEGTVKVHWRISGIPQLRALAFWKFMPWNYSKNLNEESEWNDGISTFYVNGTGLIYKHQIDSVIKHVQKEEVSKGNIITENLNKFTQKPGLAPTPSTGTTP